ncbi:hypothetical protein LINPERPRIM_LOCUS25247, partial [Linum perenne]
RHNTNHSPNPKDVAEELEASLGTENVKRLRTGNTTNDSLKNAGDLKKTKRVRKPAAALVSPYKGEGKKKVCMDKCEVRSSATVCISIEDNRTEEIEIELTALMEYFK